MASPSNKDGVPNGQFKNTTPWGEFNNIAFVVQQMLRKMQTATLVRIEACTNSGDLSPVGFVDVTPLVNQIDGEGNPTPHTTIFNVPYTRVQGGTNAIIIDPEPGDIGLCAFASRDITKIKSTKAQGNPGSFRTYNFADGMYLGGMLNAVPEQYIQFNTEGIKIYSPTKTTVEAPDVQVISTTASVTSSTSVTVTSPIINLSALGQTLKALLTDTFQVLFNSHTHNETGLTTSVPIQQSPATDLTTTVKGA